MSSFLSSSTRIQTHLWANSVYNKIMKKEMARACGHGYCAKPDKNKAHQRKRNRITTRTATLSIIVKWYKVVSVEHLWGHFWVFWVTVQSCSSSHPKLALTKLLKSCQHSFERATHFWCETECQRLDKAVSTFGRSVRIPRQRGLTAEATEKRQKRSQFLLCLNSSSSFAAVQPRHMFCKLFILKTASAAGDRPRRL